MRTHLEEEVLFEIRPTGDELNRMQNLASRLISEIRAGGKADGMMVGSVARKTCVRGDRDLDIFMLFDPDMPREDLEREGLALAHDISGKYASSVREKYAEHPYVNATIEGFDVDLVPCYRIESASHIQSAVDRTPFHNRYILRKIGDLTDDVLLLKQFVKAGGVYGSDQMTEGFSGYLCELLILNYKGFRPLIEAAITWRPGLIIDIEEHQAKDFNDPLIVIDPVDPARNVSASVSLTRLLEFIELCRGYIDSPSRWFFYRPQICLLTATEAEEIISRRGTVLYAITFETPPLIEDIIVPQLRKSLQTIQELLERHEFVVNRTDAEMGEERSMLLFELMTDTLPSVRYHAGPPVTSPGNTQKFLNKYINNKEIFAGPFIRDGRYGVELPRRYRTAYDLLASHELFGTALGKHVKTSMESEYRIHRNMDCWQDEFTQFLSDFLMKSSPLIRISRAELHTK